MSSPENAGTPAYVPYDPRDTQYWGAAGVIAAERAAIQRRYRARGLPPPTDFNGLAISGGGIRSATFALGALQALAARRVLGGFDYLSTVSGGGYIGSCLNWLLNRTQQRPDGIPDCGPDGADFPLPHPGVSAHNGSKAQMQRAMLRHLRQGGRYLTPGQGINLSALLAVVLRGMVVNVAVYLPLLVLLMAALFGGLRLFGQPYHALWQLPLLLGALGLVAMLVYGGATRWGRGGGARAYVWRRAFDRGLGLWLTALVVSALLASLPWSHAQIANGSLLDTAATGAASSLLGGLSALGAFLASARQGLDGLRRLPLTLLVWLGAGLTLYGLLLLAYVMAIDSVITSGDPHDLLYPLLLLLALVLGGLVHPNFVSVHRYYRDRLMETYLPEPASVMPRVEEGVLGEGGPSASANGAMLPDFYPELGRGPYHLINTNLVLASSQTRKFRARGGDGFLLSPLYCGSNATGWQPSSRFMGGQLTLATAMAISGAAANPNTGVGGGGPTRNPLLSTLMSLLNIRLGYWVPNPNAEWHRPDAIPNLFYPGIAELLRWNLSERGGFLQLSDGGHFENLGLYELLRRRLPLILCIDAAADPDCGFGDFGNLVEKARVDFGIEIEIDLSPMVPDETDPVTGQLLVARGFQVGRVVYPDPQLPAGILIYLRSSWLDGLDADLVAYKHAHPRFPDQSTADQFFDERQFEAYRELGYHSAQRALDEILDLPAVRARLQAHQS